VFVQNFFDDFYLQSFLQGTRIFSLFFVQGTDKLLDPHGHLISSISGHLKANIIKQSAMADKLFFFLIKTNL
jgi:hypothetical protein